MTRCSTTGADSVDGGAAGAAVVGAAVVGAVVVGATVLGAGVVDTATVVDSAPGDVSADAEGG